MAKKLLVELTPLQADYISRHIDSHHLPGNERFGKSTPNMNRGTIHAIEMAIHKATYACCIKAKRVGCVCGSKYDCPDHGDRCNGGWGHD